MRRLFYSLLVLMVAWAAGLALFVKNLPRETDASKLRADGVVVFTGGGGARISAGMELFSSGYGERLLISGVHPETSRERLSKLWTGASEQFDCCVDLGRAAKSTIGNAAELENWVNEQGYASVVIVTSDYHMPRAMLVAKSRMPDVELKALSVESGLLNGHGRPATFVALRKISGEYSKYIVVKLRTIFS